MVEGLIAEGKPLNVALEAVGMARSSYYYPPVSKRKPRALDEALVRAINKVHQGHAEFTINIPRWISCKRKNKNIVVRRQ